MRNGREETTIGACEGASGRQRPGSVSHTARGEPGIEARGAGWERVGEAAGRKGEVKAEENGEWWGLAVRLGGTAENGGTGREEETGGQAGGVGGWDKCGGGGYRTAGGCGRIGYKKGERRGRGDDGKPGQRGGRKRKAKKEGEEVRV